MAQFTKTHGDYQPVVVLDSGVTATPGAGWSNGLNASVDGATVQPQGPKLEYFTVTFDGAITGAQLNVAVETIQQLATVYIYQYNATDDDTLAVAAYPVGAWGDVTASGPGTLEQAFTDAGLTGTSSAFGATFAG